MGASQRTHARRPTIERQPIAVQSCTTMIRETRSSGSIDDEQYHAALSEPTRSSLKTRVGKAVGWLAALTAYSYVVNETRVGKAVGWLVTLATCAYMAFWVYLLYLVHRPDDEDGGA